MKDGWNFDNTYLKLPGGLYSVQNPVPAPQPELVLLNTRLAGELGLRFKDPPPEEAASLFTGNQLPEGAEPIAQAYAGHQFGHFTMLGDGRAVVLGEQRTGDGRRFDIQLKGSGQTPYSRQGDGRATLYSMLREYLISESVHKLGIPTSRSLAVAETGLPVYRETVHKGAVLTRVASSHLRIGTFEYVRHFRPPEELSRLLDYAVSRHYPGLSGQDNLALEFLRAVAGRHLKLVLEWMRTGFIHGVLNTDNMSISGETIDYGPCAFLNAYDPSTAFSSVDTHGRYAYGNQPGIVQWNLAVLAGTLLHLIDADEQKAEDKALEVIRNFQPEYERQWYRMMGSKLGFLSAGEAEKELTDRLLGWMKTTGADYTNCFLVIAAGVGAGAGVASASEAAAGVGAGAGVASGTASASETEAGAEVGTSAGAGAASEVPPHFPVDRQFLEWHEDWRKIIKKQQGGLPAARERMCEANPVYIPRNHLVEDALRVAAFDGDYSKFHSLYERQQHPYRKKWSAGELDKAPDGFDQYYKTFCGT